MLSKTSLKILRRSFKFAYLWNASPYEWDDRSGRIRPTRSKFKARAFVCNFLMMIIYEIYIVWRVYQAHTAPDSPQRMAGFVRVCFYALFYGVPITLQYSFLSHLNEIPVFINGYLCIFERFRDRFLMLPLPGFRPLKNGCEGVLRLFGAVGIPIVTVNVILFMRAPSTPLFLTSLLSPTEQQSFGGLRLALFAIHWQIWMSVTANLVLGAALQYLYLYPTAFILRELIASGRTSQTTLENLRTPAVFMQTYRMLQTELTLFHQCFQYLLFPVTKVLLVAVATLGTYGAIKLGGPRAIAMALLASAILLHFSRYYSSQAKLHTVSKKVLSSWKGKGDKHLRAFLQSCRTLDVEIGSCYTVRETTVLTLFGVIVNATITLLLT